MFGLIIGLCVVTQCCIASTEEIPIYQNEETVTQQIETTSPEAHLVTKSIYKFPKQSSFVLDSAETSTSETNSVDQQNIINFLKAKYEYGTDFQTNITAIKQ